MDALIANARFNFHKRLFETNTLTLTSSGVASNADTWGTVLLHKKVICSYQFCSNGN